MPPLFGIDMDDSRLQAQLIELRGLWRVENQRRSLELGQIVTVLEALDRRIAHMQQQVDRLVDRCPGNVQGAVGEP